MAWQQIFLDDFNRANSTTVGNDWLQATAGSPGVHGIVGNQLYVSPKETRQVAYLGIHQEIAVGNTRAVQWVIGEFGKELVVFLGRRNYTAITTSNSGYGYRFRFYSPNYFQITKLTGSSSTLLASSTSTPATPGTHYRLEHTDAGQLTLMSSLDGDSWTTFLTATDSTYMSASDSNPYGVGAVLYIDKNVPTSAIDDFRVFDWQDAPSGYTVDISAGSGGSVSTAQLTDVDGTTGKTFTATPNAGYRIASITPSTGITVTPSASGQTGATTFTAKATQAGSVLVAFETVPITHNHNSLFFGAGF